MPVELFISPDLPINNIGSLEKLEFPMWMLNKDSFDATLHSIGLVDLVRVKIDEGIRFGSGTSLRTMVGSAGDSGGRSSEGCIWFWSSLGLLDEYLAGRLVSPSSSNALKFDWGRICGELWTSSTGLGDIGCPSPRGSIWKKSSPSDESEVSEVVQESSSSQSGSWALLDRSTRPGSARSVSFGS